MCPYSLVRCAPVHPAPEPEDSPHGTGTGDAMLRRMLLGETSHLEVFVPLSAQKPWYEMTPAGGNPNMKPFN